MKRNTIKTIAYALAFSFAGASCSDFLNEESKTAMTEEAVFSKIENIEPLVIGLYNSVIEVKKGRGSLMFNFGIDETKGGERQLWENPQFLYMDSYKGLMPSNERLAEQWASRWPVVTAAAKAIYALSLTEEEPDKAKKLLGEASFVRGIFTYELAMLWGEVLIIDRAREKELGYRRQPLKDVWEFIINDLKNAAEYMPETQSDKKRATCWAGWMMLGKAYMSAPVETGLRDFDKARECFEKVMPRYTLMNSYADLWDVDQPNCAESIFEFQFRKGWPNCNHWMNDLGSGAAYRTFDAICWFAGWDMIVPTPWAYSDVTDGGVWEEGDTRKEESIRYDFTYDGKPCKPMEGGAGDELLPHIKKFEDIRTNVEGSQPWESGKHFAYLRLGDVILCHAECLNELGRTAEAVTEVNDKIRARAWNWNLPADKKWNTGMSKEEFRTNILNERTRELSFEGWRRMDLIRTGNLVKYAKERNPSVQKANAMQDFHVLYPIPDTEIKGNKDISEEDQNPGYGTKKN